MSRRLLALAHCMLGGAVVVAAGVAWLVFVREVDDE
jgi:hypothetical protein